ncbi:MAG: MarR family transcriptional regulator [Neisseriaceae bacterium]|nr:MarR family transcriptional regulator [Neisseriaceae bacterium]
MSDSIYTSKSLENHHARYRGNKVLFAIKTKGPIATATLAQTLGMTAEAARQQVQKLVAEGLIAGQQVPQQGAGRPSQSWVVTAAGHRCFPDTHAQLTEQLIQSVRQLFGEAGLEKLIEQKAQTTRLQYQSLCSGATLFERLQQLTNIRNDEGYMARLEQEQHEWLLIEDHCPICVAAQACQGFCRAELELFQDILGPDAHVVREQHLLSQGNRCVYRITPLR